MSQRDHGLIESVAAVPTPTSPRKRQKTGKEDESKGKQDGSSKQIPAMSTDPVPRTASATPPPDTKVEMTIRSQPQGATATNKSSRTASPLSAQDTDADQVMNGTNDAPVCGGDGPGDSPPVIAIDDDDVELIGVGSNSDPVRFIYDSETYFGQFPYTSHGNYMAAIHSVTQHLQANGAIDGTILPQITLWLDSFPDRPLERKSFITEKSPFWDELYTSVNRLLNRKTPFGDTFCDESQSEDDIFTSFFSAYLRICARLYEADAELLSEWSSSEPCPYLVSIKHIRLAHLILREGGTQVFYLLSKDYGANLQEMSNHLMYAFVEADGPKNLFDLTVGACDKTSIIMHNYIAIWAPQLLDSVGWYIYAAHNLPPGANEEQTHRNTLEFFRRYNYFLQDPSKVADAVQTKDIINYFSNLLFDLCQWHPIIADELLEEMLNFRDPESPTTADQPQTSRDFQDPNLFPTLVRHAWKFKLLRKYVVKGRMEVRVMSIGTMDTALVDIWKEYNEHTLSTNHPIMQYIADFLLHERVVDYIISVDSHPQLISRSGNIVGFLVVTGRYSERQTDAIWNTASKSSDPRVVSATMSMLRNITNLMQPPEILYLVTKLHDVAIESCTVEMVRFMRDIVPKLHHVNWSTTDVKARPWNVFIRLMQETSPTKETNKLSMALHMEAAEQLRVVSSHVRTDERHELYRQCANHIASRSPQATGSVHAIYLLVAATDSKDIIFFEVNSDVTRLIIEETCAFIGKESMGIVFNTPQACAIQYRLDLLSFLISRAANAIPSDLHEPIWDHLVGKYAQTIQLRDLAWSKLLEATKGRSDNGFCKQLISVYVPNLEPEYYTIGMFDFVAAYRFPTTRRVVETSEGQKLLLQIRGADLLWSMIRSAPPGTIEERTATLLASRYLELDPVHGITLQEMEQAHVALVEECTQEILSCYKEIRDEETRNSDKMDVVLTDPVNEQKERRFTRTVLFLKMLLMSIRTKAEFNRSQRSDSKVESLGDEELPDGDVVELKYQITSGHNTIVVGLENTLHDVYLRLCRATGFSKINMFAMGKKLNLAEDGSRKVASLDLARQLILVQKASGGEVSLPVADIGGHCSVFETAILNRFEELFACMDAGDSLSATLQSLLLCFPYPERIADSVAAGTCSADELFPPAKHYKACYAAYALYSRLEKQLKTNNVDDNYLVNAVQLFDQALLNPALIIKPEAPMNVDLANALVHVLLTFLKVPERPSTQVSSSYFSNEKLLVERLLDLVSTSLSMEPSRFVVQAYATIIEASLHSRGIWDAFINAATVPNLHKTLLLDYPSQEVRSDIAKVISSVCGGALSPSSALTESDTATSFWRLISSVLPHAVECPGQSEQLFDLADLVFRKYDEIERDEASLRLYLTAWSDLLLRYHHVEIVGRGETDFVVLGLSRLLLSCISSLKSFKKPLNAGQLVEKIWNKFLFVPRVVELEDEAAEVQIPVLESTTRKELFDLVLALAEDRNSYQKLLELAALLKIDDMGPSTLSTFDVDRKDSILSPRGYLGLNNPRAICYMNSLLAQLFMNVNFRKFMLGINVADPAASQRLLQETQKLFAMMQNSYRKFADPQDFAACVRVPDGGSIDINIQMDADEFYNLLFDQWEAQMLSPETKQQFRSFYGGQTVNQIKSKECEHVSERLESFFVVQCDVQGKSSLNESLQAFVEGDVMEGENKYKCESCGGKLVDAVKRTCLKDVPDNLIFHLKRFDFDLVNLSRAKINDHFDFPMAIDVSPFKVDHLSDPSKPRQEDWFDLVGVLVHQGSSEAGHYYSYIRSRPTPEHATQWNEFNDKDVDAFDPQYIASRAFGGFTDQFQRLLKNYSAYMLFYQRRSAIEKDHTEYSNSLQSGIVKVPVSPAMEQEISVDNEHCIREYSLYDPHHTKFVRQALANVRKINHGTCSEDHVLETQALHIALEHLFLVHIRVRTPNNFEETLLQLRKSALSCSVCCLVVLRWLADRESALLNMLILCEEPKSRSQSRAFVVDCLRYLREIEPAAYSSDLIEADSDTEALAPSQGILHVLVEQLRTVAEYSYLSVRSWDDFYLTLCQINDMGHIETSVLLSNSFLRFCLEVFCMPSLQMLQQQRLEMWRATEKRRRIYNRMVEFVYSLLSKMEFGEHAPRINAQNNFINRLDTYDRNLSKFPLTSEEQFVLLHWYEENKAYAALDRMLENFDVSKTEVFYPGEILKWMMQWPRIHTRLHITVCEGILQLEPPSSDPYVRAGLRFCQTSPNVQHVDKVVKIVANSATRSEKHGGEAHLEFFIGLLHTENEAFFESKGADWFFSLSLDAAMKIAVPLLMYENDLVRQAAARHLENLFTVWKADQLLGIDEEILVRKYETIRSLAQVLIRKVEEERRIGMLRSYMQPMISTCSMLILALDQLQTNEDPAFDQYKLGSDINLIQYHAELEVLLGNWSFDEGTPQSLEEGFDHSDYGSESEVDADLLEI